jgi:Ca2+-binding EF-hand superfamily protein
VDIPAWLSVTIVAAVLLATVLAGLMGSRRRHSLTLTERTMVARRFAVFDIDGNGIWQRADYEQLTRRLCGTFGHAADSAAGRAVAAGLRGLFDALLRHMDTNGDQEITQDEFAAAITRPVADRPGFDAAVRTAAATLIQVADRDGNGVLDPREYAELTAACGAGPDDAARAFGRLDLDHNGVLDAAELTLAIGHFFASPGADHYGNVAFGHI